MLGVLIFSLLMLLGHGLFSTFSFVGMVEVLVVVVFLVCFFFGWNTNSFLVCSLGVFGLDGMSFILILLSLWCGILMVLASFYLWKMNLSKNLFGFVLFWLVGVCCLSFSVSSYYMFYILFEFSLVPTFFLIMKWGYQPERIQSSMYMVLYTVCASLPLLFSLIYMEVEGWYMDMFLVLGSGFKNLGFGWSLFLVLGFLVKMPLYFFHLWLPKAHVEAPVSGSMILAGILLKLGSYGLLRVFKLWFFFIYGLSDLIMCVSLVGGVMTSIICIAQSDLKALIAYSSIGHMGIVSGGIMTGEWFSLVGSLSMMVAHGLCSSGMFYLSNTFYSNSKSRSVFMNKGVLFSFPFLVFFSFLIFSCNMSAPPSINLAGELILSMGILSFSFISAIPIFLMTFLSGGYSIYLYVLSCHGSSLKVFSGWKELKNYDFLVLIMHFLPIWGLILNLKLFT